MTGRTGFRHDAIDGGVQCRCGYPTARMLLLVFALLSMWACNSGTEQLERPRQADQATAESAMDTLARLETDLSIARLGLLGPQRRVDSIADVLGGIPSALDTTASVLAFWSQMDSLNVVKRRVTLAERELDRFRRESYVRRRQ